MLNSFEEQDDIQLRRRRKLAKSGLSIELLTVRVPYQKHQISSNGLSMAAFEYDEDDEDEDDAEENEDEIFAWMDCENQESATSENHTPCFANSKSLPQQQVLLNIKRKWSLISTPPADENGHGDEEVNLKRRFSHDVCIRVLKAFLKSRADSVPLQKQCHGTQTAE